MYCERGLSSLSNVDFYEYADPYGGQYRLPTGQFSTMQWMPVHPAMGYSMYGDARPSMYFDPRLQNMPFRPGFPPMPPVMQGPFPGRILSGKIEQPISHSFYSRLSGVNIRTSADSRKYSAIQINCTRRKEQLVSGLSFSVLSLWHQLLPQTITCN